MPMPPALETAAARGPPDVRAMPASMMGCLMPRRVHSGVVIVPEVEDDKDELVERWEEGSWRSCWGAMATAWVKVSNVGQ